MAEYKVKSIYVRAVTIILLCSLIHAEVRFTIKENLPRGYIVGQVLSKSGLISQFNASMIRNLQYTLMSRGSLPTDYFHMNNRTSELSIAKEIDRDSLCDLLSICCDFDKICRIDLQVAAQPTRGKFFVRMIKVRVKVLDENDNSPKFPERNIEGHISEVAQIGTTVILPRNGNYLIATDSDTGINTVKNYSIISPTETFGLRIENIYGAITDVAIVSLKELDREKIGTYNVVVIATDGGTPTRTGSVNVKITIDDFNDNDPVFDNTTYTVHLNEDVPIDTEVIRVQARDADIDLNADINYSIRNLPTDIISRLFTINSMTGQIRTKGKLNFEEYTSYRITVEATDEGAFIQRKSRCTVIVNVRDVNDHGPLIKLSYLGKNDRPEVPEDADIGTFVAFVTVSDPDKDAISCEIDSPMFRLKESNPNDPNEFHLVTAHALNRENSDEYRVTLTCTDQGMPQMKTAESFSVYVLDANDNPPRFRQSVYTASVTENNQLDIFLLEVKAVDNDLGENARIIYSLDDRGRRNFSINSLSGRIYTKQSFNREEYDQIQFKVLARDNATRPLFAEATVIIRIVDENDNAPTFHNPKKFEISEAAGPGVMLGQMSASDPDMGRNALIHFELQHSHDTRAFAITRTGLITTLVQLDREIQSRYHIVVIAKDDGREVVHSSSVTVTIKVTDINDNVPVIRFPNTYNNTVYISYLEPVGHTVTQINATDADEGRNAFLDYAITQGNEADMFRMNQNTGALFVAKQMTVDDASVYKLGVRVMDRAEPYNSNVEILNIVVDGTGKAISIEGTYLDSIASNKNLIIVICLAAVSGVLAIILVVAIVCIRKTDREQHQYSVTAETQKMYEKRGETEKTFTETKYMQPLHRSVNYSTEVDDSPLHNGGVNENGNSSHIYSSLRPAQHWRPGSVYPKVAQV